VSEVGHAGVANSVASPSCRKIVRCDLYSGHIFRHVCFGRHDVSGWPARIQVHKVFKHCERKVLRRVDHTSSRSRPTPSEAESAFAVEWRCRERLAQQSVDRCQLTPP
jgi:hypothetical protein